MHISQALKKEEAEAYESQPVREHYPQHYPQRLWMSGIIHYTVTSYGGSQPGCSRKGLEQGQKDRRLMST
jgi:hypothetical protein